MPGPDRRRCDAVVRLIDEVAPDTILTFGPEGMTGHPDHQAVSRWTTDAWLSSGRRARLLYATLTPQFHDTWGELNERLGIWMYGPPPSTPESDLVVNVQLDAGGDGPQGRRAAGPRLADDAYCRRRRTRHFRPLVVRGVVCGRDGDAAAKHPEW